MTQYLEFSGLFLAKSIWQKNLKTLNYNIFLYKNLKKHDPHNQNVMYRSTEQLAAARFRIM